LSRGDKLPGANQRIFAENLSPTRRNLYAPEMPGSGKKKIEVLGEKETTGNLPGGNGLGRKSLLCKIVNIITSWT